MNTDKTPEIEKMYEEAREWLKNLKVELFDGDEVVYKDSWEDFKKKSEMLEEDKN